ncbi:hypothetical protein PYW08_000501 [Mythimna loreyi]|uniref:Uncharacterized protein n=1 Tax=Mythimna loreyi TaxID=667449 RepID=A0ACC2RCX1_9NEOP|nr:hypothetical protein PYW08_000501 [Mythimna loreyi]
MSDEDTQNFISLRSSAQMICENLNYAINTVLFGRVIFPPKSFKVNIQYGITLFILEDPIVKAFLDRLLRQIEEWIVQKKVFKLSLVIRKQENNEVVECWDFNIYYENGEPSLHKIKNKNIGRKDKQKIEEEIKDFMIQVDNMMACLPFKFCQCYFNILVHVNKDIQLPKNWMEVENLDVSNPKTITYDKTISTSLHKLETNVSCTKN